MKTIASICISFLLIACSGNKIPEVDFMIGSWKMEGKEQYEVWESSNDNELIGYSYKFNENQKIILETLSIKRIGNKIIYEATVPDQNEGKAVPFNLNDEIQEYLSFENLEHDFPKKIQYKKINDDEIEVTVLGDEGKGFSYKQLRHE